MPNFSAVSNDPAAARLKQTTSPQIWSSFHLGAAVRLVAGVHCPNCATETRAATSSCSRMATFGSSAASAIAISLRSRGEHGWHHQSPGRLTGSFSRLAALPVSEQQTRRIPALGAVQPCR